MVCSDEAPPSPRLVARQVSLCSSSTVDVSLGTDRSTFPFKLYEMLEYASDHGLASIVWAHDGEAFEIIDADALMDDVAPLFFKQSKFRSFTRESISRSESKNSERPTHVTSLRLFLRSTQYLGVQPCRGLQDRLEARQLHQGRRRRDRFDQTYRNKGKVDDLKAGEKVSANVNGFEGILQFGHCSRLNRLFLQRLGVRGFIGLVQLC